ncbi:ubiquitin-2 like Rad60 SUMO-like-domain-containing protein [Aspergillus unguis]
MRSYFNKPSWASRGDADENSEFYRRAPQTYQDIVATNLSAHGRKAKPAKTNTHKRRRLSIPPDAGDIHTGEQEIVEATAPADDLQGCQKISEDGANGSMSPTVNQVLISKTPPADLAQIPALPTPQESPDDKLPNSRSDSASSPVDTTSHAKIELHAEGRSEISTTPRQTDESHHNRKTAHDDAVVQILITSEIGETKPLLVHRKMSQSLKGVRLAWCAHQKLPQERHSDVFLTWKGRRLFDVTTCRSLNINARTALTENLSPFLDCFQENNEYRIHIEAVTEEIFAAGHRSSPDMVEHGPKYTIPTKSEEVEEHAGSEIILKCPGHDDFKVHVPLTTCVYQVVGAFREAKSVSAEMIVYLAFDGDRLDPQSRLIDHEIVDGDLLDVLVKTAG